MVPYALRHLATPPHGMPLDDALLDALLPARAEEATPEDLERAAALCQQRADKVSVARSAVARAR